MLRWLLLHIFLGYSSCAVAQDSTLFQVGNASALFGGATEGDMNFRQLKNHGDFGLGTFNGIQGEMIALDGNFYQIGPKGKTTLVDLDWKTPFAELVTFSATASYHLSNIESYKILKKLMYPKFKNKNIPYTIRIQGYFKYLELRSRSPRPALQTKNILEETYSIKNISGTYIKVRTDSFRAKRHINGKKR